MAERDALTDALNRMFDYLSGEQCPQYDHRGGLQCHDLGESPCFMVTLREHRETLHAAARALHPEPAAPEHGGERDALIEVVAALGGAVEQIKALGSTPSDNAVRALDHGIAVARATREAAAPEPAAAREGTDERAMMDVLRERDEYVELLDQFAYAVAPESEIGEHSSSNDPWSNALSILRGRAAAREAVVEAVRGLQELNDRWNTTDWDDEAEFARLEAPLWAQARAALARLDAEEAGDEYASIEEDQAHNDMEELLDAD